MNGKAKHPRNGVAGRPRLGYAFIHSAVDAHSRLAYSKIHPDEEATTAIGFWLRAKACFGSYGITVERVLTDNGSCYRASAFDRVLLDADITHTRTKPYKPQTNGKGGALQPDASQRVGLRPPLPLRRAAWKPSSMSAVPVWAMPGWPIRRGRGGSRGSRRGRRR